ncbi:MAG TPA: DotI/IcmL family type IV secretion protein [Burkholderiaceae bacterium]|nr:DotI/IcmL family type IV secretion protein [Burkholderiaceae bacterium]
MKAIGEAVMPAKPFHEVELDREPQGTSLQGVYGFEEDLDAIAARLHGTKDTVLPAVRVDRARRLLNWLARSSVMLNFILGFALAISVIVNFGLVWFAVHPVREYFASDNGRLFPMIPLGRPYRKPADAIQYAKDTLNQSFTLDFNNWRSELEGVRYRYDAEGFKSYLQALQQSGILETVRTRRMNMSITTGTGVLVKEGIEDGRYTWYVEAPIELKFAGQTSEMPSQRFKATVRVARTSTLDNIEGIDVSQLITKPN